ncbi:Uncharacterised protein [Mycobacteroides abscessus subsp. abscessus]|nr:Uncharacterised protein [Mycobacteroides abscessus subsp. abscessus]SIM04102.1 Uncharacterised protein [Mycobacteroides abscessus subsp. abscessus]SKU75330.1 Uncharacterised protein [Mycobacteroides abscessus subsp. abscessus]
MAGGALSAAGSAAGTSAGTDSVAPAVRAASISAFDSMPPVGAASLNSSVCW